MYDVSNFKTPFDVLFILGNLIFQCFIIFMLIPSLAFQNCLESLLYVTIQLNEQLFGILKTLCNFLLLGKEFSNMRQKLPGQSFYKQPNKEACSFGENRNFKKPPKFETNLPNFSNVETKECKACPCNQDRNNSFFNSKNIKSQFQDVSKSGFSRNCIGTQTTECKNAFTQYEEHLTPMRLYSNTLVQGRGLIEKSNPIGGHNCFESSMLFHEIDLDNSTDNSNENSEHYTALLAETQNMEVTKLDTTNTFSASTSATNQTVVPDSLESSLCETSFLSKQNILLRFSEETVMPTLYPEEHSFFKNSWRKLKQRYLEKKKSLKLKNTNNKPKLSTIFGRQFTSTEKKDIVFKKDEILSEISSCCSNIFQGLKFKVKRQNSFSSVAFKRF